MLQIPCLEAESISDCSEEYEFLLYLLNHIHKNMKTIEQLNKEVEQTNLPDNKIYFRHFKGNIYKVLHVAKHSETLEDFIVYQAMYGEYGIWVRPKAMFEETITRNGQTFRRFSPISEEEALKFIEALY